MSTTERDEASVSSQPAPAAGTKSHREALERTGRRRWRLLTLAGMAFAGLVTLSQLLGNVKSIVEGYKTTLELFSRRSETRKDVAAPVSTKKATPKAAPRVSIVVLPFENLSKDPEQEYFADAITDDVTTDLSRVSGSFVIARNTAFSFKGKPIDVTQLGRELGVRYALTGSVARISNQVRVNAQLIDTESGAQIWTDRFNGDVSNLSALHEQVVGRLGRELDLQLTSAASRHSLKDHPDNPDAVDLVLRANAILNKPRSRDNSLAARKLFAAALDIDSKNVEALTGLAWVDTDIVSLGWDTDTNSALKRAETEIDQALALSPNYAKALWVKGIVLSRQKRFDEALAVFEAAILSNPNYAPAYDWRGFTKLYLGRADEVEQDVLYGMRLSPRDPRLPILLQRIGTAKLYMGNDVEATSWLRQAASLNPTYSPTYPFLASAYALQGKLTDAKEAVSTYMRLRPGSTAQEFFEPRTSDNPTFKEQHERVLKGLRAAGFPQ